MEAEQKPEGTPRSIADAVQVVQSAQTAGPVPGVGLTPQEPVVRAGDVSPPPKLPFYKQKKVLIAAGVLGFLLMAGGGFLLFGRGTGGGLDKEQQNQPVSASVSVLEGTASLSSDGENWQDLTARSKLHAGDLVRTASGARVALVLENGSAFRLDEATTVILAELAADTVRIEQKNGGVYSRTAAGQFEIVVDNIVYTATDAAFYTANTATRKGVRVLQGSAQFDDITIAEGKQYFSVHENNQYLEKITDIPLEDLKSDGFLLWNLDLDEKDAQFKQKLGYWQEVKDQQRAAETIPAGAQLVLETSNTSKGTELKWTVTGITAPDGFKIVRSQSSPIPVFGRDESQQVDSPTARSYTWASTKEGTFNYRVCVYRASDSSCTLYSNTSTIESKVIPPEAVVPGAVTLALSEGMINWTFEGTAPHGFEVLVSASSDPAYPKDAEYLGATPYMLKSRPSGVYYIKVCKYTGSDEIDGGCVDYSNQVIWNVP